MKYTQMILLVCGLAMLASGCSTMSVPDLKVRNADTYEQHQEKEGLAIGIHVMTDTEEVKKTFGMNLLEKGITPVLIVVENRSPSASFVVAKEKVYILDEVTGKTDTTNVKDVTTGKSAAGAALGVAAVAGAAVGSVVAIPFIIASSKLASDAQVIEYGIANKEFSSSTLDPGVKAEGFIYFQLPKKLPPSAKYHIVAQVKNSSTGTVIPFDFDFNPPIK